jgi:chromosome segregation ATPase
MDEFERELRIEDFARAYEIATAALRRAQVDLQLLRADRRAAAPQIEKAIRRCQELTNRRHAIRQALDEFEDQDVTTISARRSTPELRPR